MNTEQVEASFRNLGKAMESFNAALSRASGAMVSISDQLYEWPEVVLEDMLDAEEVG